MSEYKVYKLNSQSIDYIRWCLKNFGHSLTEYILKKVDLEAGSVTTGLPANANIKYIENFRDGGLYPLRPKSEWIYDKGSICIPKTRDSSYALDTIRTFLDGEEARICIFNDFEAKPTDQWLKRAKQPFTAYNNEVYWLLVGGKNTVEKIESTMSCAQSLELIGILTSLPKDHSFFTERKLTSEIIEMLADRTEKLVVLAYDGEGYIIWHRSS